MTSPAPVDRHNGINPRPNLRPPEPRNPGTPDSRSLLSDPSAATVLRGLAILAIVLHNFLHLLPQSPGENEMDFDPTRAFAMVQAIAQQPASGVRHTLSFFGHYGVQVFIFLSGYGLTRKFAARVPGYAAFLGSRVAKIYPLFLMAILVYLVRAGWSRGWHGPIEVLTQQWESLLLKLTLMSNFVPDQAFRPVGPWWFVPFIFQFYAIFPLLFAAYRRWGSPALITVSATSLGIVAVGLPVPVMTTVIGHLPIGCLGVWLASRPNCRPPIWMVALAVPLFVLGNVSQAFWPWSHLGALVLMLGLWTLCGDFVTRHGAARIPLAWFGGLALPLFLVNGFLRQPFLGWAEAAASEVRILAFALLFVLASVIVAWCLQQVDRLLRAIGRQRVARRRGIAVAL